jgi:SAM-dependent methyltransferase
LTGFNYDLAYRSSDTGNVRNATWLSILNYMHAQLGLPIQQCESRLELEISRQIPKAVLRSLHDRGWDIAGKRLLDLGAGQGGMLLECLASGADAYGIEPGEDFHALASRRLEDAGYDARRLTLGVGEHLPYDDCSFDYVVSLQVLEHVRDPLPVLREIHRVLKPGGQCYLAAENYLSFFEPHYRVAWLPLLPKRIGAAYLRLIGRPDAFLLHHVFYTTYPTLKMKCQRAHLRDITEDERVHRFLSTGATRRTSGRLLLALSRRLPPQAARQLVRASLQGQRWFRSGLQLILERPA